MKFKFCIRTFRVSSDLETSNKLEMSGNLEIGPDKSKKMFLNLEKYSKSGESQSFSEILNLKQGIFCGEL